MHSIAGGLGVTGTDGKPLTGRRRRRPGDGCEGSGGVTHAVGLRDGVTTLGGVEGGVMMSGCVGGAATSRWPVMSVVVSC